MILDTFTRTLIDGDRCACLSRLQCAIVEALARAGGGLKTNELISRVWGDDEPDNAISSLWVHVNGARERIIKAGIKPVILTVWGSGYKLAVEVEVRGSATPVVIPHEHRADLERLLFSHPDKMLAGRVLAAFVGG